ncbi:MAG: DUF1211 domain-containing protein [Gammaproteobacteria bacterium]|nr:DUF1211 domain-containing protein [Gammaproteobacteria bacterium]
MGKQRLEAFSDGVIAIIITIMVLEMKVPHSDKLAALQHLAPVFISYILSFIYVGIYWNNHHHLLHTVNHVNARILWANLHLLFWLSLIPFVTNWVGENHFSALPVAVYSSVFMCAAIAYYILSRAIITTHGPTSHLATAVGKDFKGKISIVVYLIAIPLAFWKSWLAFGLNIVVAALWLIPDRRIERVVTWQ